ncbi:hypothetical protein J5289_06695 [Rhizobium sp. B230/85]|uniref:hypothetical protein n=1 Tax=unclassified Rhizobium TaxID=2613769 RepID=UPI001ADD4DBA|nr:MULTISPECIES: hypothetical protein [unclassified Rhizobium]MBO9133586.1 hypothetical protein [Rhizobium sp. B209b/85]QXZ97251.1 hypothetical protein J5289_06695 [Rhizobium sp. B230/85]
MGLVTKHIGALASIKKTPRFKALRIFCKRYASLISLNGVVLGVFLASEFFLVVFWFIDITKNDDAFRSYFTTILTIAATALAALIALFGVSHQIRDGRERDLRDREAALVAANSLLPMALHDLIEVCDHNIRRNFDGSDLIPNIAQVNRMKTCSAETLDVLKASIQHAAEGAQARLSNIIRNYQVTLARTEQVNGKPLVTPLEDEQWVDYERNNDAVSWASLKALVSEAFAYARENSESIPAQADADRVSDALGTAGLDFGLFPNLKIVHDVRKEAGRLFVFA